MTFILHPNFESKLFVADLPLCRVLLENEKHYPWILLVPRVPGISKMMDLPFPFQVQLLRELDVVQKMMWQEFQPTQLNVAAIGNKTPQLHVHVIARYEGDPAWPGTVWDHPVRQNYDENAKNALLAKLETLLINSSGVLKDKTGFFDLVV